MLDMLLMGFAGGIIGALMTLLLMSSQHVKDREETWNLIRLLEGRFEAKHRNLSAYVRQLNMGVAAVETLQERQSEQIRALESSRRSTPSAN